MKVALLVAASLLLVGLTLVAPSADAACTGTDPVGSTCAKALCTTRHLTDGSWLIECWGVVGPVP